MTAPGQGEGAVKAKVLFRTVAHPYPAVMTSPPPIHPAREMDFRALSDGLKAARANRLVYERPGPDGLLLYVYTERCVFEDAWNPITMVARGLILDPAAGRVVATPFPKFFNAGERGGTIPDLPFETFEKLDGSLIIIFHHAGRWRAVTKGSFDSAQAQWAQARLDATDLSALRPGGTYLAEATYPENRIVVRYDAPALVLLAAFAEDGTELDHAAIGEIAARLGWAAAERHRFGSVSDLLLHARDLPGTREGFVLRFTDGTRLKVKGNEYKRIHALISRVTPLAMWEAMAAGDAMSSIKRELPEEFWDDFDQIVGLLEAAIVRLTERVARLAEQLHGVSDKDVGLRLQSLDPELRPFIFAWRKQGGNLLTSRSRDVVFRAIRPTGNVLPGYVPSYALGRVLDEAS
jgi:RNA ligase